MIEKECTNGFKRLVSINCPSIRTAETTENNIVNELRLYTQNNQLPEAFSTKHITLITKRHLEEHYRPSSANSEVSTYLHSLLAI